MVITKKQGRGLEFIEICEDVIEVLAQDGKGYMLNLKAQAERTKSEVIAFRSELTGQVRAIRAPAASASAECKKSAARRRSSPPFGGRTFPMMVLGGALTQSEATAMATPAAYVWRGLCGQGCWQGQLKPHARVVCAF